MFYNDAKKIALAEAKKAERVYNSLGEKANYSAIELYNRRKSAAISIDRVESYINNLANTPKEFIKEVADVIIRISEFKEAIKIEKENSAANIKGASLALGGTVTGGTIAALGPTAAMAVATTFGTASTGTAISTLSGAAATKAALAWLGGGALSAGGGGMAAGNAFLALAGPIGWSVAGVTVIGGCTLAAYKNKVAAKEAHAYTCEINKKIATLKPLLKELDQLLIETLRLKSAISTTPFNLYPSDYNEFNIEQKKSLQALINNTKALGVLINERIGK